MNVYVSISVLRVNIELWRLKINNNNIRVVKYECEEYFKL